MDGTILEKKLKLEEKLAQLNEIAQKVDDMPVYTSTDRAWLDEWEEKLPELPSMPTEDGETVLKATTEDGATTLSWGEAESTLPIYSSTPQKIGVYVDSSNVSHDLYRKVVRFTTGEDVRVEVLPFATTNIWLESGKVVNGDQVAPIPVLFVGTNPSSTFFYKDSTKTYLYMNLSVSNWRNKSAEITFIYCQ